MLPTNEDIVQHVRAQPGESTDDLGRHWGLVGEGAAGEGRGRDWLAVELRQLERQGDIVQQPDGGWVLAGSGPYRVGVISVLRRGTAIVRVPAGREAGSEPEELFVRREDVEPAAPGDLVLVELLPARKAAGRPRGPRGESVETRPAARVVRVLEHSDRTQRGTFRGTSRGGWVEVESRQAWPPVRIPASAVGEARTGDRVLLRLRPARIDDDEPVGEIVHRLRDDGSYDSDEAAIRAEFSLPGEFAQEALEEAGTAAALRGGLEWPDGDSPGRVDLRELRVFTIDPDDAEDFDDAVSIEPLGRGRWRLGVHIADVSHYVRKGTALDVEAESRGTSIYLPGSVIPMLPERLSNDLCSLRPDEDRLTKSVFITLGHGAVIVGTEVVRSVIRSCRRFTYDEALAILARDEREAAELPPDAEEFAADLDEMARLREALRDRRHARGALMLDLPKPVVRMDAGRVTGLSREDQDPAHALIEEFMLLANEAVAGILIDRDLPLPARVHSGPDDERFEEYRQFLTALGITYRGAPASADLQHLVESTADDPLSDVVQIGLLRTMGHAEYVSGAGEHFALATSRYCHFTSPIRRYPDLLVHQIIDDWLDGRLRSARRRQEWLGRLPATLEQSSEMERRAEDAERALLRLRMIRYLEARVDEQMRARIVSVRRYGFYVRVAENLVEGLVHISSLGDDYFEFEPDRLQLVGRRGGDAYAIGDEVVVRLDEVLPDTRDIGFRIVRKLREKNGAGRQRRGAGSRVREEQKKKKDGRAPPRARRGNQRRSRRRRG